jgi:pyruvate dehydrogenase E2 component (dihydrolipoamide acetyltransferase)
MATPIEMPKLGITVEECLLTRWNKRKGDKVSAGETVAEIETDKTAFDLAAPIDGIILDIFFNEGEIVPVFANVCVIGEVGESIDQFRPQETARSASEVSAAVGAAAGSGRGQATSVEAIAPAEASWSPRARRFAEEHEFHPETIVGSGPGGRILEEDVKKLYYSAHGMIGARDLGEPPIRVSKVRQTIARRMRESLSLSAQYTLNTSADATGLLGLRNRIKASRQDRDIPDINISDMVIFCAVKALLEMPEFNADFIDGKLHQHSNINIGFACDTPRGLLVPVVKNCQKLSLEELASAIKTLTQQAVEGTISPDDLTGGTFTVSNMGNLGIESFTPILNPPQVALLGVNSIEVKPVRTEGRVEFIDYIGLSLTCDHQVIDGAPGARFLKIVRRHIENIESISALHLAHQEL